MFLFQTRRRFGDANSSAPSLLLHRQGRGHVLASTMPQSRRTIWSYVLQPPALRSSLTDTLHGNGQAYTGVASPPMAFVIPLLGHGRRFRLPDGGPVQHARQCHWPTALPSRWKTESRLGLSKALASCSGRKKQARSSDGAVDSARML